MTDNVISITWKEILCGSMDGVQVWKEGADFRQISNNFNNRKKSIESLKESSGVLHHETHGDQVQTLHLLHSFCRSFSSHKTCCVEKFKAVANEYEPILLNGYSCKKILQKNESVFVLGSRHATQHSLAPEIRFSLLPKWIMLSIFAKSYFLMTTA